MERALVSNGAELSSLRPARFKQNERPDSKVQADLGASASLIVFGVVAYRIRRPVQTWWRRRSRSAVAGISMAKPSIPRPHAVSSRARATAHRESRAAPATRNRERWF